MKQKLSQLQTPYLAGFIREKNLRGAISENGEDSAESIRAMLLLKKEVKPPVAYHANDKAGMLSRVINPLLGGQIAFCVDHYDEGSTMEDIERQCSL